MATLHDKLIAGLVALGCEPATYRYSSRYTVYTRPWEIGHIEGRAQNVRQSKYKYWFVGRSGALRYGNNGTSSLAANDAIKQSIIAAGTQLPVS